MENDIKEKLEKFLKAKIPIHIVLKIKMDENGIPIIDRNGNVIRRFLNGMLIGKKAEDIFIIDERKLGRTYVLVDEVYDISVYSKNNKALAEDVKKELGFSGLGEGVSDDEINLIKDIKEDE